MSIEEKLWEEIGLRSFTDFEKNRVMDFKILIGLNVQKFFSILRLQFDESCEVVACMVDLL